LVEDAGNSSKGAKDEYLLNHSGVSDSIEQHTMSGSKPGGQTILGVKLKAHRVCRYNREKECGKRKSG
jgi:hypothetical protein